MGQCYCYEIKDNTNGNINGAIDLKEFITTREGGTDSNCDNRKQQDQGCQFQEVLEDEDDFDDWEGAIQKRNHGEVITRVGASNRRRQRARPFDLRIVIIDEMKRGNKAEAMSPTHRDASMNVQEIEQRLLLLKRRSNKSKRNDYSKIQGPPNLNNTSTFRQSFALTNSFQNTLSPSGSTQNLRPIGILQKIHKDLRPDTIGTIRELFQQHYLLQSLPREFQDLLITHLNFYAMESAFYLYKQDESTSDFMYVILEGSCQLLRNNREVEKVDAPFILGEAAVLHSALRTHSVLVLDKIKVCTIHRSQFKELVKFVSPQHCAIAKDIIDEKLLFSLMEKKQQAMLVQEIGLVKFKKGSIITKEGDEAKNLYIVNRGVVVSEMKVFRKVLQIPALQRINTTQVPQQSMKKLMTMPADNYNMLRDEHSINQYSKIMEEKAMNMENFILKEYNHGDLFGFEGFISRQHTRLTKLRAVEDVECFCVSKDLLQKVLLTQALSNSPPVQEDIRTQLVFSIFEKDDILKTLGRDHRLKIIEAMNFREFQQGEPVLLRFKPKNAKLVFCLKGRLVLQNDSEQVFLSEGETFGAAEMYSQPKNQRFSIPKDQFEQNIIADPFCIIAEITKESIEQALGEEFYHIIQKNSIVQVIQQIPLFSFLPFTKLEWISEAFQKQKFNANETVYSQDTQGTTLYIIHKGQVDFYQNNKKIMTLNKASYFEDRSLFFTENRQYQAIAADQTTLFTLDKNDFASLVEPNLRKFLQKRMKMNLNQVRIEELVFVEKCASGTFKNVYEVEDRVTLNRYALKVSSKSKIKRYNLQSYVQNERSILADLDHPFIIKMIKTFKDQKRIYFLTEMVKGMDLFNELSLLQVFNKRECQFNVASIILVIEHLHSKNIIHRDIKPENIFIDEEGFIKILDLGTCKKIQDRTYTLVGTPAYSAPEIFLASGYDYAADYWSLGICIFEFLCGYQPFGQGSTDPLAIYKDITANQEIQFPEFLQDAQAKDLIKKLLTFKPEQRFTNPKKLKEHQWFENFDFDALLCRLVNPPFVPKLEQYASSYMSSTFKNKRKRNSSVDSQEKYEARVNILDHLDFNDDNSDPGNDYQLSYSSYQDDSKDNSPMQQNQIPSMQSFTQQISHQQSALNWDKDF